MNRRAISSIALALGIFVLSSRSDIAGAPQSQELWLFDTHSHHAKGLNLEDVIARMDAAGVGKIVLFARRQGTDEEVLALHVKYPDRVVPAVGFQNPGWLRQDPRFLGEVEAKLKSGRFQWMGELLLKHYGVPELQAPEFDISPDTDLFRRALDLSARYRVPVTIHHEAEEGNIEIFRRTLRHNQKALVVWAHWCGRSTAEIARSFLREFPNLYCDLGASHTGVRYGREKNPLVGPDGTFLPDWKALIEEFSDRFLAAIDAVEAVHYQKLYRPAVEELRKALANLSPEAARKVAFANAERLLGDGK
jgi:Tat protein secretion system quality control protein TatD with DNase activity